MNITVVGYGIQGRAQALNLRDSGHEIQISNQKDKYFENAIKDGFNVSTIEDTAFDSEIVFLLIPLEED